MSEEGQKSPKTDPKPFFGAFKQKSNPFMSIFSWIFFLGNMKVLMALELFFKDDMYWKNLELWTKNLLIK